MHLDNTQLTRKNYSSFMSQKLFKKYMKFMDDLFMIDFLRDFLPLIYFYICHFSNINSLFPLNALKNSFLSNKIINP